MQELELAEHLSSELAALIREEHVAANVRVIPASEANGPFVEVGPSLPSMAPEMSIHVLSSDGVALTIGETSSADWEGDADSVVATVRSLAVAMFHGDLAEEVVRDRKGRVIESKLLISRDAETKVVWQRSSPTRWGRRSAPAERRNFPAYPSTP